MRLFRCVVTLFLVVQGFHPQLAEAQGAGPYTPEQVYFLLHDAVRDAFGVSVDDPLQPVWVSLSTVGSVVDPADKAQVNLLANFCPPATPVLAAYGLEPKLDLIYENVINGIVGPKRQFSDDYKTARAYLVSAGEDSAAVKKYGEHQKNYVAAWLDFVYAKDAPTRHLASIAKQQALEAWRSLGFRYEVDRARSITEAEESRAGEIRQQRRRTVLADYRDLSFQGTNDVVGAFKSPVSGVSPPVSNWQDQDGWVHVSYSAESRINRYTLERSAQSGFGGLSLGFLTIGASGGGGATTETKLNRVYNLSYDLELKRVAITRPWLDATVFFQPYDWTWRKVGNTPIFPHVAVERAAEGRPIPSPAGVYDNHLVACSLLPLELIIARKRTITATVSKADYQKMESSSSVGGAVGLFGIFGGVGQSSSSMLKINEDAENVTFMIDSQGLSVIGLISQFLPLAPQPNALESWPANAWLP